VHDIDNSDSSVLEVLTSFFGRGVGANIDVVVANCDLLAISFVDDTVNLLEVVGVGDNLVVSEDVL